MILLGMYILLIYLRSLKRVSAITLPLEFVPETMLINDILDLLIKRQKVLQLF